MFKATVLSSLATGPFIGLKEEKLAASGLLIKRDVPEKSGDNLLIETWNIEKIGSNGARKRKRQDHVLIAELIKPFDIIAVQEVMPDLWGIREIMESLNEPFKMVITDVGGNSERLVYIYTEEFFYPIRSCYCPSGMNSSNSLTAQHTWLFSS